MSFQRQGNEIENVNSRREDIFQTDFRIDMGTFQEGRGWPKVIGISEIISGMITAILGALEVFVIPFTSSNIGGQLELTKQNCFGAGMYAGFIMVITGSTAVRATISKRSTTIYRFYNLTMFTLLLYVGLSVFLIVAYGLGWTVADKYANKYLHLIHMGVTISTVIGLMFAVAAFVKYFSNIFFGEMQLARRWAECFCPRLYPRRHRYNSFDSSESTDDEDPLNNPV